MHAENLLINNGSDRETVEAVSESFPKFDIIASLAFIVKTVNSVN
jgi:hypothetical protein